MTRPSWLTRLGYHLGIGINTYNYATYILVKELLKKDPSQRMWYFDGIYHASDNRVVPGHGVGYHLGLVVRNQYSPDVRMLDKSVYITVDTHEGTVMVTRRQPQRTASSPDEISSIKTKLIEAVVSAYKTPATYYFEGSRSPSGSVVWDTIRIKPKMLDEALLISPMAVGSTSSHRFLVTVDTIHKTVTIAGFPLQYTTIINPSAVADARRYNQGDGEKPNAIKKMTRSSDDYIYTPNSGADTVSSISMM